MFDKQAHLFSHILRTIHTYYSKDISDIRHKDGQYQHHTHNDESCNDVNQPGEGTSSTEQQDHSLTGLKCIDRQRSFKPNTLTEHLLCQ